MRIAGRLCATGEEVVVTVEGDRIGSVELRGGAGGAGAGSEPGGPEREPDLGGPDVWVSPGFIDLQLNGYGGCDFNRDFWSDDGRDPRESISRIVAMAANAGTTQICPTICTNSREAMTAALRSLADARDADPDLRRAIPAIHVEGPWIASEDGPRGAHPLKHVRDPDWSEFEAFQDAAGGAIGLVTLAPERDGALILIEQLTDAGIVVGVGHTGASPTTIREAARAGGRLSTHLGNGAHAVMARHPNYIWEQLANDDLLASIIADGHHLPAAVVKCFARVKGPDRLILVSDAVSLGGRPPGIYDDGRHEVLPSGKVVLAGTPYLAGAGHLLDVCAANFLRFTRCGPAELAVAASVNPARLMGWPDRQIAAGCVADLTLFRLPTDPGLGGEPETSGDTGAPLEIVATIRSGRRVDG